MASQAQISSIIQPGGSINDNKVIEAVNKEKIINDIDWKSVLLVIEYFSKAHI